MDWKESTDEGEGGEYKMPKYYFLNMYEKQNNNNYFFLLF